MRALTDNLYSFALSEIDIDMLFSESLEHFDRSQLESILIANSGTPESTDKMSKSRKNNCLVHLLTGKEIRDNNSLLHGLSTTASMFSTSGDNVGATSIATCKEDPWKFSCLITFVHELGHNLGADNEALTSSDYLMSPENDLHADISPNRMVNILRF